MYGEELLEICLMTLLVAQIVAAAVNWMVFLRAYIMLVPPIPIEKSKNN